jgi:FlaA1/EpsC-like NDP-sugar epimerase
MKHKIAWLISDYVLITIAFRSAVLFPHDVPGDQNLLVNALGIPVPIIIAAWMLGVYKTRVQDVIPVMWKFVVAAAAGFVVWTPMLDIFRPAHLSMNAIGVFLICAYGVMFNLRVIAREWVDWRARKSAP